MDDRARGRARDVAGEHAETARRGTASAAVVDAVPLIDVTGLTVVYPGPAGPIAVLQDVDSGRAPASRSASSVSPAPARRRSRWPFSG